MMTSDGDFDYVQTFRYYNGEFYVVRVANFHRDHSTSSSSAGSRRAAASLTRSLSSHFTDWLFSAAIHFILIISIWTVLDDMVLLAAAVMPK